ncbi:BASS family bile acid:Na+ symporter [Acidovorax sp. 93]|jgi:BASS family bile acid:Na+ symporter|uniref:bile acid:sodium symporter family protein n=1 Tax=Acidovorax TaxID=12916 RepID=UPI0008C6EE6C|nr:MULTISPECIES: bile acid:sodium symporter family protein [unclassified Acidovorax]MBT9443755.1 bile acid:sodium symporter family protein [Acidovorax sp.]OGA58255.1 MAG: bile acid:sodium symporter [Burkholderiales bacterium RIFCSPHIGHO2_01_FULL_64_960]OGA88374.1 MAG: bile acid:sodium symporter [Burkholderiales bacterium GWA2_64_37]OGB11457.1 MAG: bile acid:sodium symporter [Burkholderiales bacterium RIFCSPHIGHO2_02_FULL_64_19]OGB25247.1 MAG: bile acid:sodium symporter [Burkholderiales bacteri
MSFVSILPTLLFIALGLVMFGLGLSLTVGDFKRLLQHPRAVVLALVLQVLVLPSACYALIVLLGVAPLYAVGLMLLAASPGGVSANLFSHLFGGNVAMNISLTAINTVLSIVSLPLITNWAINTFAHTGQVVPLQFGKVVEVIIIVLVPVVLGMAVHRRAPAFSARMEKPMKIFSAVVLAAFALIAIAKEWTALVESFAGIGPAVLLFNAISLASGYYLSRAAGLDKSMATAISFEIGIHNSTLAIFIALSVLGNFQLALPAAIYSVSMYILATLFGGLVLRRGAQPAAAVSA